MGELHRDKKIANDFNFEVKRITEKIFSGGFPRDFVSILLNISIRIRMVLQFQNGYLMNES